MMEQDILVQARALQERSEETERGLAFIEEQIHELELFQENLNLFEKGDKKEILASIGRGVSIPAQITDTTLFVEVGAGVVLRKTPAETQKIIREQIRKFDTARAQLQQQLQSYVFELSVMMKNIQTIKKELKKKNRELS